MECLALLTGRHRGAQRLVEEVIADQYLGSPNQYLDYDADQSTRTCVCGSETSKKTLF